MTTQETLDLVEQLSALYDHFRITPGLAKMWADALVTTAVDDMEEALKRYVASGARENFPPTLSTLLTFCTDIRRERRKAELAQQADENLPDILASAADRAPEQDKGWAKEHVRMAIAFLNHSLSKQDAPAYCIEMAAKYPAGTDAWLREAELYYEALNEGGH